jgi:hypothetical protein
VSAKDGSAGVGDRVVLRGDRGRHDDRRLAHREDHGPAHHEVEARGRLLRGDGRRDHLFLATALGIPVSTTHTITGAIVGVGSTKNVSAVRWGVAGNIVWAWIFTIPASAFMAGVAWWLGRLFL